MPSLNHEKYRKVGKKGNLEQIFFLQGNGQLCDLVTLPLFFLYIAVQLWDVCVYVAFFKKYFYLFKSHN